jgi:hypothetical protein
MSISIEESRSHPIKEKKNKWMGSVKRWAKRSCYPIP